MAKSMAATRWLRTKSWPSVSAHLRVQARNKCCMDFVARTHKVMMERVARWPAVIGDHFPDLVNHTRVLSEVYASQPGP